MLLERDLLELHLVHASLGGAGESGGKNHVALHDVGVQSNTRELDTDIDNDNRDMADGYIDNIPLIPWMRRGRLLWARRHRTGVMTQAGGIHTGQLNGAGCVRVPPALQLC